MTDNSTEITSAEIGAQLSQLALLGYRFTRPFTSRTHYSDATPPEKLVKAIILDTETTGTDSALLSWAW